MNNTRDPFGLRNFKTPAFLQQSGSRIASRFASGLRSTSEQAARYPYSSSFPPPDSSPSDFSSALSSARGVGMSHATDEVRPHSNSTSSVNNVQFREQDVSAAPTEVTWQHRRTQSSRVASNSGNRNRISSISNYFTAKTDDGLPMYKDKPYNYDTSSVKRLPVFRRQRLLLFIMGFAFMGVLYWLGLIPGLSEAETRPFHSVPISASAAGSGGLFGLFGKKPTTKWETRREHVREAFRLSWKAYEDHAWGYDEFHPISQKGEMMVPGGMGWIIVDALDTMMIMNLTTELSHARDWIKQSLTYDKDHDVNTFETTIRMLGGLLSAHYLSTEFPNMAPVPGMSEGSSAEDLYLEKATDLADRLLGAYQSKSGIPYASVNLHKMQGIPSHADGGASSTAEAATLQLEMKYLAKLTGEKQYWEIAERVIKVLDDQGMKSGLLPIFVSPDSGMFRGDNIRLGSRGDSYYEYLIKQFYQTSKQEPVYEEMWDEAVRGIKKYLITYSVRTNLTVLGERPEGLSLPSFAKMDHLCCFFPGTWLLGLTGGAPLSEARKRDNWGPAQEEDFEIARQMMKTCYAMYKVTKTGLAPEIAHFKTPPFPEFPRMMDEGPYNCPEELDDDPKAEWRRDFDIHAADFHNLQRPETVESLFYFWRITGDEKYRDWGWEIFQSFIKYTAVPNGGGFTSLHNVDKVPPPMRDNMESFWLSETLKYFYLLFGPNDVLPLENVVFNTEAHPFPRFELGKLFSTGWKRIQRDASGDLVREQ